MAKEQHCGGGAVARRRRTRYLPEDLQEKILVQLPVKSLHRFESVCKTWRSMFHSRSFIDSYGIRCPRLVFYTSPYLQEITRCRSLLHNHDNNPKVRWRRLECVLGPLSNGMYCITSHTREEYSDFMCSLTGMIGLCDPSTGYYKAAPYLPFHIYLPLSDKIASFSPTRANVGFGKMNPSSADQDYKVVVLISHGKPVSSFLSLVYIHQSGEWKIVVDGEAPTEEAFNTQGRRIIEVSNPLELRPQRFLEGRWHWIAVAEDRSFNVLSFNFADEAFELMGAPPGYVRNESSSVKAVVSVLHDHLVVIYLLYNELSHCVEADVWMMMDYGVEESWTKMYNINPNSDGDRFERQLGIDYSTQRDEESGCVRIESLSFRDFDKQQIDLLF